MELVTYWVRKIISSYRILVARHAQELLSLENPTAFNKAL
jgi:hypothetical protein